MKLTIMFAAGLVGWALAAGSANADTIFDVEHARADARAGRVSEMTWNSCDAGEVRVVITVRPVIYDVRPYRRGYSTRYDRRGRRW